MKKILAFLILCIVVSMFFVQMCFAEEAAAVTGAAELTYTEKEQIVKGVLDKLLEEGDELWSEKEPWEIFEGWVRSHMGEIIAGVGGFITLAGSLLVLFKTNPRFKASIEEFKLSCKGWLKNISEGFDNILNACNKVDSATSKIVKKVNRLENTVLVLVTALEDVIKLSGADEGKKELYIRQIENAKSAVNDKEAEEE